MWYNSQAVAHEGGCETDWSLKIEQQERSTKHSKVRNTNLVKRVYIYSNKVKEAKIEIARKQIVDWTTVQI